MSGVNQFRQLFVVKHVDDNDTYILDKTVNNDNIAGKISSGLYVFANGAYSAVASGTSFNKATKYYVKDVSKNNSTDGKIVNEAGEIEVNTDKEGNIYFSYGGQGSTTSKPKPIRSDLIEPDQIVDARITMPSSLNKGKQIQHSFFEVNESYFAKDHEGENEAGVAIAINFTNFGNGVNSIYPFSVFVKKFVPAANASSPDRLVDKVVAAINDAKIVDLAGNSLITAEINSNKVSGKNLVEIIATPTGDYVAGKTDVYYPQFTVSVSQDDDNFISDAVITEFTVNTTVSNWDVASEMELAYVGSRINGGQTLPYNFPFNGNFKQMVEEGAYYSAIDIHYYKTNDPDFSQKSHGTITLLVKENASNSVNNALIIAGKIKPNVVSNASLYEEATVTSNTFSTLKDNLFTYDSTNGYEHLGSSATYSSSTTYYKVKDSAKFI